MKYTYAKYLEARKDILDACQELEDSFIDEEGVSNLAEMIEGRCEEVERMMEEYNTIVSIMGQDTLTVDDCVSEIVSQVTNLIIEKSVFTVDEADNDE